MKITDAFLSRAREGRSGGDRTELVVHVTPQLGRAALSTESASAEAPVNADRASAAAPPSKKERAAADVTGGAVAVSVSLCACLDDGTRVAPEALRRLGCDDAIVPVIVDGAGLPIDVGRKTRVVRSALRRALSVRDGAGCRFPGCDHRGWIDAHHIEHWIDGGETTLANLNSLCPAHHRAMHEGGFSVELSERGDAVFRDAGGRVIAAVPDIRALRDDWRSEWRASAEAPLTDESLASRWNGRRPDYRACIVAGLPLS